MPHSQCKNNHEKLSSEISIWAAGRIVIMADYDEYCWIGENGEGTELDLEFPDWPEIRELHYAFLTWLCKMTSRRPGDDGRIHDFDWVAFHKEGIFLCKRLKSVLKESVDVCYMKPFEDPQSDGAGLIRID